MGTGRPALLVVLRGLTTIGDSVLVLVEAAG